MSSQTSDSSQACSSHLRRNTCTGMWAWQGSNTSERSAWHPMAAPDEHAPLCFGTHTAPSGATVQSETNLGWSEVEVPLRRKRKFALSSPQAPFREAAETERWQNYSCDNSELKEQRDWSKKNICATAKSCSVACGGLAGESDGELVALRSERQDVAVCRLELKHDSSVTHQLQACMPPRKRQFLFVKQHLLKHREKTQHCFSILQIQCVKFGLI